jgi:hypothetical protein
MHGTVVPLTTIDRFNSAVLAGPLYHMPGTSGTGFLLLS